MAIHGGRAPNPRIRARALAGARTHLSVFAESCRVGALLPKAPYRSAVV
jgi:hypothetical protein